MPKRSRRKPRIQIRRVDVHLGLDLAAAGVRYEIIEGNNPLYPPDQETNTQRHIPEVGQESITQETHQPPLLPDLVFRPNPAALSEKKTPTNVRLYESDKPQAVIEGKEWEQNRELEEIETRSCRERAC